MSTLYYLTIVMFINGVVEPVVQKEPFTAHDKCVAAGPDVGYQAASNIEDGIYSGFICLPNTVEVE